MVRRSGGAAGSVLRRSGSAGGACGGDLGVLGLVAHGLLFGLQRTADTSVLADTPEVHGQEQRRHQRHQDHVQDVEAQERVLADLDAAQQQQLAEGVLKSGAKVAMLVPMVMAQKAIWSQGSR